MELAGKHVKCKLQRSNMADTFDDFVNPFPDSLYDYFQVCPSQTLKYVPNLSSNYI